MVEGRFVNAPDQDAEPGGAEPEGPEPGSPEGGAARRRILEAAFREFMEHGYADTSTLAIATRAKVSKRSLYALVGNKQQILAECIRKRAVRFVPAGTAAPPKTRAELAGLLTEVGAHLLREVTNPKVIAVYRLAIAESARAPEVGKAIEADGEGVARKAIGQIMAGAQAAGLVSGEPAAMAGQFLALLWGNLMVGLAMRVVDTPDADALHRRAAEAAEAVLRIYPAP